MADILQKILATKQREVAEASSAVPLAQVKALAAVASEPRDFEAALNRVHAARTRGPSRRS